MTEENTKQSEQQDSFQDDQIDEQIEESELIREFAYPKGIKQVKILIAIAQLILGATLIVLPAIYFVNPADDALSIRLLGIVAIIAGVLLVALFPPALARAINSKLELGEKKIKIRNSFRWKEIFWKDLQEILITEKLSNDPTTNKSVGANLIRFRTISRGYYFYLDSYPIEIIKKIKESLKETFNIAIADTGYIVQEKHERPSIRSRFVFYEKVFNTKLEINNEA